MKNKFPSTAVKYGDELIQKYTPMLTVWGVSVDHARNAAKQAALKDVQNTIDQLNELSEKIDAKNCFYVGQKLAFFDEVQLYLKSL